MVALNLYITEGGLSALLDAQDAVTNAVRVAELGLTAEGFAPATTLEELPGEFKRIATIAGVAVSDRILHMIARDTSTDTYTVRGLGLYLDDGELFAVIGQEDPIFEKASVSTFLLAADFTFAAGIAELIEFGDTNFLYPPATEDDKGVAYLATAAEVDAGEDAEKIVTPAALAGVYLKLAQRGAADGVAPLGPDGKVPPSYLPPVDSIDTYEVDTEAEMLALPATPGDFALRTDEEETYILRAAPATVLGNWAVFLSPGAPVRSVNGHIGNVVLTPADVGAAPATRSIATGGLAQGGGNLGADRTITVPAATAEEALAGLVNDKAITPAALSLILAALAGATPAVRQILTAGLATGGGNLGADRTITVPKASAADVMAGADDTKAVTPAALFGTLRSLGASGYLQIPGTPVIIQWGSRSVPGGPAGSYAGSFPFTFPTTCWRVFHSLDSNPNDGDEADEPIYVPPELITASGFTIHGGGDRVACSVSYLAIGF